METPQVKEKSSLEDRQTITIKPIKNAILVRIGWETESFSTWQEASDRIALELAKRGTSR